MIRIAFILIAAAMATAGVAAAFDQAPARIVHVPAANQTVVEKNSAFPVIGPVAWTQCRTEDCSDVPN